MAAPYAGLPSLGSSTGTRLDSAAKHIMACKMDSKLLGSWLDCTSNVDQFLHQNKLQFCMHKDEIVLNTSRRIRDRTATLLAYPLVITTLGLMKSETKLFLKYLYGQYSASHFHILQRSLGESGNVNGGYWRADLSKTSLNSSEQSRALNEIQDLPDFRCQGVALS